MKLEQEELGGAWRPSSCLAASAQDEVVIGTVDGKVRIWKPSDGRNQASYYSTEGMVIGLGRARPGVLYSVSAKGLLAAWGYETMSRGEYPKYDLHDTITCAAFNGGLSSLAIGTSEGRIKLWDLQAQGRGNELPAPQLTCTLEESHEPVVCLALDQGGRWLACAGGLDAEETAISLWDLMGGRRITRLHGHAGAVTCLAVSPDGKLLASGGYDGSVRVWDFERRMELRALKGKGEWMTSLLFSPNGELVLSGSSTGAIWVWDLKSGSPLLFPAHSDVVTGLAAHPVQGFYSTSLDGMTRKWRVHLSQAEFHKWKLRALGQSVSQEWQIVGESL